MRPHSKTLRRLIKASHQVNVNEKLPLIHREKDLFESRINVQPGSYQARWRVTAVTALTLASLSALPDTWLPLSDQ